MKLRRSIEALVTIIVITLGLSLFQAVPASAASAGDFSSRINALRASKGLGTLSTNSSLAAQAQSWAQSMANKNAISHNPNLGGTPGNWTKVGENVGTGGAVDAIFDALVASPGHYRNMVDGSFNAIGVGVAMGSDGRIYTCHVFAAFPSSSSSSSKASSAPAKPASTSSNKPAAPATTAKPKAPTTTAAKPAATTTTTTAPAAPAQPSVSTPSTPVTPVNTAPAPSQRIVIALTELGSIATQG